jgi:hypothetical protein
VPPWATVLYLILADLQNTVLSAWMVFAERLIYPSYAAPPSKGSQRSTIRRRQVRSCGCRGRLPSSCPSSRSSGRCSVPKPHAVVLGHQHGVRQRESAAAIMEKSDERSTRIPDE